MLIDTNSNKAFLTSTDIDYGMREVRSSHEQIMNRIEVQKNETALYILGYQCPNYGSRQTT